MSLASTVLMVRPASFGFNAETAVSNHFQQVVAGLDAAAAQQQALDEFDAAVAQLRAHGLRVLVVEDTPAPPKPDAVFPNNWLTLHPDGRAVLYPMCAPNRRPERRPDILALLAERFMLREVLDLSAHEAEGHYLEGTGSIVFDHAARVAYAALSPRTDAGLLAEVAARLGYAPCAFRATDAQGQPIYHTNVLMCLAPGLAAICLSALPEAAERAQIESRLRAAGREIIDLSFAQIGAFAGNMLALQAPDGQPLLVLSGSAHAALTAVQRTQLARHCTLLPLAIPTIERLGGGSARCMLAEVWLPEKTVPAT